MMIIALLFAALLMPGNVWAVTRDTATQGQTSFTQPITVSHTVTAAGANRAIFLFCSMRHNSLTVTATYAGNAMELVRSDLGVGITLSTWVFRQVNPATGANNWVATASDSVAMACYAVSATDVDQTTPLTDHDGQCVSSSTASSVTLTTATGEILWDVLGRSAVSQSLAQGADQTDEIDPPVEPSGTLTVGGSRQAGADGGAMSWGWSGSGFACHSAISVKSAPTALFGPLRRGAF